MGVISESAIWEDSVLQIEVGDSVGGGPSAVANLQAQDLANRTKWLKENKFDASNFGEFYPTGVTPTYVDANNFTVAGDLTAIFTKGRVLKITDTGGTFNAICATSAYDSGTGLTTVTVAGDTIDSGISAVLYAVSQQTSAIWESGANANGKYVKFVDGTMICTQSIYLANNGLSFIKHSSSLNWYVNKTFTYPAEFSKNPTGLSASVKNDTGYGWASVRSGSTTITNIAIYDDMDRSGQAIMCSYTAIGRWY